MLLIILGVLGFWGFGVWGVRARGWGCEWIQEPRLRVLGLRA